MDFLSAKLQQHLDSLIKKGYLFLVDLGKTTDRPILLSHGESLQTNDLWKLYLYSFDESDQQSHRCWCCHQFIKYYGGIVHIDPVTLELTTLWDFQVDDPKMQETLNTMSSFVKGQNIISPWYTTETNLGTAKSLVDVIKHPHKPPYYHHWYARIKEALPSIRVHEKIGQYPVVLNSLKGIKPFALKEAIAAAEGNDLPRSEQLLPLLNKFKANQDLFLSLPEGKQNLLAWVVTLQSPTPFIHTMIGSFVNNLSEGMDYETAHRKLCAMEVGYQRPSGACSPLAIRKLKEALEKMGLMPSLKRKVLSLTDLDPNYLLFYRHSKEKDIFDTLADTTITVDSTKLKAQEVSLVDFLKPGFLSGTETLEFLFEHKHKPMLFSLIGGEKDHKPLTMWENNISWAFRGGGATAISERVKAAGGVTDAPFRISLAWHSYCDLDLHAETLKEHVYYSYKRGKFLTLDVDMNAGHCETQSPVENIYGTIPSDFTGTIYLYVVNFYSRSNNQSFEAELKLGDQIYTFSSSKRLHTKDRLTIATLQYEKGQLVKLESPLTPHDRQNVGKEAVWGISTASWIPVLAMTPSPNYWQDEGFGNKFLFLYLQGCVWGEKEPPRGIFNEMISSSLTKDHKQALEALGNLIQVSTDVSNQASGVAFNTSTRTDFYVRVDGHKVYHVIC